MWTEIGGKSQKLTSRGGGDVYLAFNSNLVAISSIFGRVISGSNVLMETIIKQFVCQ